MPALLGPEKKNLFLLGALLFRLSSTNRTSSSEWEFVKIKLLRISSISSQRSSFVGLFKVELSLRMGELLSVEFLCEDEFSLLTTVELVRLKSV